MMRIEIRDVCYEYKTKKRHTKAVQGRTYTVEPGRFYSIVGASGCGKTTLLSLLAGLRLPTSGDVIINGENTKTADCLKIRRESLSVIYQDFNLFPYLTAEENAEYSLLLKKAPKDAARKKARETLEKLGIMEDQFGSMPSNLSGGEQQRVAIARALAADCRIILADEPTGSLDSKNSSNIVDILRDLAHEDGCCVIVVTHDRSVSEKADVVIELSDGKILGQESCHD